MALQRLNPYRDELLELGANLRRAEDALNKMRNARRVNIKASTCFVKYFSQVNKKSASDYAKSLTAEEREYIDEYIHLQNAKNLQAVAYLKSWYELVNEQNPDVIIFSVGSHGCEEQVLPPFVRQNKKINFAILNIDPAHVCKVNFKQNYSCSFIGDSFNQETPQFRAIKKFIRQWVAADKKIIVLSFVSPPYVESLAPFLKDHASLAGSSFAYAAGYFSFYPMILFDRLALESKSQDLVQETYKLFEAIPDVTDDKPTSLLDVAKMQALVSSPGTKIIQGIQYLKLDDFGLSVTELKQQEYHLRSDYAKFLNDVKQYIQHEKQKHKAKYQFNKLINKFGIKSEQLTKIRVMKQLHDQVKLYVEDPKKEESLNHLKIRFAKAEKYAISSKRKNTTSYKLFTKAIQDVRSIAKADLKR